MNRRLAEHRDRKPASQTGQESPSNAQSSASRRAQEAAARVAARYAKAPSYSEVLATEARAALRAAEVASEAALLAKAAAQSVLDNIEAASSAVQDFAFAAIEAEERPFALEPAIVEPRSVQSRNSSKPEMVPEPARKDVVERYGNGGQPHSVRWAPELPVRPSEPAVLHEGHGQGLFEESWWKPNLAEPLSSGDGDFEIVDAATPIHGNLIEFPREIVATRKVRPRLAESPFADSANAQLSIFEVDPNMIATEPTEDSLQASTGEWTQPAWSGLELDAQPFDNYEELNEESARRPQFMHDLQPASLDRRIMALFVDGTLIAGTLVGAAALALHHATALPNLRTLEAISAAALVLISAMYITLFYAIAPATPGMKYARIGFCTFEGYTPTRSQRWNRLAAMLLSVLPAGLGLAWSLFDDDHLSWHDRLSSTYICNL